MEVRREGGGRRYGNVGSNQVEDTEMLVLTR
jgi:hypothetical protein